MSDGRDPRPARVDLPRSWSDESYEDDARQIRTNVVALVLAFLIGIGIGTLAWIFFGR